MIKVELSVRESLSMIANGCSHDMFEKIVVALETALGVNQRRMVTITGGMSTDNRIPCIKAIRLHTGWGLREAKDWSDVLVGHFDQFGKWRESATGKNSMTLKTPEAAENLLRDLADLGCQGFLS